MKRIALPLLLALATATLATTALARTEWVFNQGGCLGGGSWWSVSKYNEGVLVEAWGLSCDGFEWHKSYCNFRRLDQNPLAGLTPNQSGTGDAGPWEAYMTFAANGIPSEVVGRDATGAYWRADMCEAPPRSKSAPSPGMRRRNLN